MTASREAKPVCLRRPMPMLAAAIALACGAIPAPAQTTVMYPVGVTPPPPCTSGCPTEIVLRDSIGPDASSTNGHTPYRSYHMPQGTDFGVFFPITAPIDCRISSIRAIFGKMSFNMDWSQMHFSVSVWSTRDAAIAAPVAGGDLASVLYPTVDTYGPLPTYGYTISQSLIGVQPTWDFTFGLSSAGVVVPAGQTVWLGVLGWTPGNAVGAMGLLESSDLNGPSDFQAGPTITPTGWRWISDAPSHCCAGRAAVKVIVEPLATCPSITTQPQPATTCPTGTATFSVTASGTDPFTYQWQIEDNSSAPPTWLNLADGPIVLGGMTIGTSSGTTERTWHTVLVASAGGTNRVRCLVSNACGSTTSDPATLTICPADFDCSGGLAVADIFAFLNAWFAGSPAADFDGVNGLQIADVFAFLNAWFSGC